MVGRAWRAVLLGAFVVVGLVGGVLLLGATQAVFARAEYTTQLAIAGAVHGALLFVLWSLWWAGREDREGVR